MGEQRTLRSSEMVTALANFGYAQDAVSFVLRTKDGDTHTFGMKLADLAIFIASLTVMAQQSAKLKGPLGRPPPGTPIGAMPIDATALGALPGQEPGETFVIVDTGGVALAFAAQPEEILSLRNDLARLAPGQPS